MASTLAMRPGMKAPAGQVSNFVDPPSKRGLFIAVGALAIVLSTLILCLRLYTRCFINRKLWWDDWTCILGWIGLTSLVATMFKALDYGGGVDLWNVPLAQYRLFVKVFNELFHNIEIVYGVGIFFNKASIVLLFYRIFIPGAPFRRSAVWWAIWFVFWWNLLYHTALVFVVATECIGKGAKVARGEPCLNEFAVSTSANVINVVSDLMIFVIPIMALWNLQMARSQKYRVLVVFGVGSLGVMASIASLGYLVPDAAYPNQKIVTMVLEIFGVAQQTVGVIVGCLPVLPAFFRHVSERYHRSSSSDNPGGGVAPMMNSFFARKRAAKTETVVGSRPDDDPSGLEASQELDGLGAQSGLSGIPTKSANTYSEDREMVKQGEHVMSVVDTCGS